MELLKFILPHQLTGGILALASIGGQPFWIVYLKSASIEAGPIFRQILSIDQQRRAEALCLYHQVRP
jgi:hypothetical protein